MADGMSWYTDELKAFCGQENADTIDAVIGYGWACVNTTKALNAGRSTKGAVKAEERCFRDVCKRLGFTREQANILAKATLERRG